MQTKLISRIVAAAFLVLPTTSVVFAQDPTKREPKPQIESQKPQKAPNKPTTQSNPQETVNPEYQQKFQKGPPGPSFYIGRVEGSQSMFSILLTDASGTTVSGMYTVQQVAVFEAVLEAARVFALSDEKVGSSQPITTRLMEQFEWSLFVDVSKIGAKSRLFVSLITPTGKLTAQAGEITRGSKEEPSALLLTILSQVREARVSLRSGQ